MSFPIAEKQPPSPAELKSQMLGAAVALNFVEQMITHYPEHWTRHGRDICELLAAELYKHTSQRTSTHTLWKILTTQKPTEDAVKL